MATTPRRPACDRCFYIKERCSRIAPDGVLSKACERCARLDYICVTERQMVPVGRSRKPDTVSKKPQPAVEFVWDASSAPVSQASEAQQLVQAGGEPEVSETWQSVEAAETANLGFGIGPEPLLTMQAANPLLSGLTLRDRVLLSIMFDKPTFIYNFLLGPQDADRVLKHLFTTLIMSPEIVLSSFLATTGRLARRLQLIPCSANLDYIHIAKGVRILRKTTPISMSKAKLLDMVTLGISILTFDILDSGLYAHSISRNTLVFVEEYVSQTKLLQDSIQKATFLDELGPILLPLVLMDTYNSIIRRQIPVLSLQFRCQQDTDGYIGFCRPLLPYMFNLCCISHKLATFSAVMPGPSPILEEEALKGELEEELDTIECALRLWNPSSPDRFTFSSSTQEIIIIDLQAKIHLQALLLIIHRLRYPFGREDTYALEVSNLILTAIEQINSIAISSTSGGGLDKHAESHLRSKFDYRLFFAFFIAAVEIIDPEAREAVMQKLDNIIFTRLYKHITEMAGKALAYFWKVRDEGNQVHWFDLADGGPSFVLF